MFLHQNSIVLSVDSVVNAIFDEDFGLSDEDESNFDGSDDIRAFLGEPVLLLIHKYYGTLQDEENIGESNDEMMKLKVKTNI